MDEDHTGHDGPDDHEDPARKLLRDPPAGWDLAAEVAEVERRRGQERQSEDQPVVLGARGRFGRDALLDHVLAAREAHQAVVQVFDPPAVYGREHLEAACQKALRSHRQDRAIARDLATEIACYAAGTDQISAALETVGVPEHGEALVLLGIGPPGQAAIQAILEAAGLEHEPVLPAKDPVALDRLGISQEMREQVPQDQWGLLVQERVALVDAER